MREHALISIPNTNCTLYMYIVNCNTIPTSRAFHPLGSYSCVCVCVCVCVCSSQIYHVPWRYMCNVHVHDCLILTLSVSSFHPLCAPPLCSPPPPPPELSETGRILSSALSDGYLVMHEDPHPPSDLSPHHHHQLSMSLDGRHFVLSPDDTLFPPLTLSDRHPSAPQLVSMLTDNKSDVMLHEEQVYIYIYTYIKQEYTYIVLHVHVYTMYIH